MSLCVFDGITVAERVTPAVGVLVAVGVRVAERLSERVGESLMLSELLPLLLAVCVIDGLLVVDNVGSMLSVAEGESLAELGVLSVADALAESDKVTVLVLLSEIVSLVLLSAVVVRVNEALREELGVEERVSD